MAKKVCAFLLILSLSLACVPGFAAYETREQVESDNLRAEPITITAVLEYGEAVDAALFERDDKAESTPENFGLVEVLKSLNINLVFDWYVDAAQYETKLSLALSSGEYPDILKVNEKRFLELLEAGVLLDLAEAFETCASDGLKAAYEGSNAFDKVTFDGKIYAIPETQNVATNATAMWYRADWADALGIARPTNLSELLKMIEAFGTLDPDGNGVDGDTFGLAMRSTATSSVIRGFLYCFGAYGDEIVYDENGEAVYGYTTDSTLEALKTLQDFYARGIIDPECVTYSYSDVAESVIAGKVGVYFGDPFTAAHPLSYGIQYNPNADWKCIALLGEDGPAPTLVAGTDALGYNVAIDTGKEGVAEALVQIVNLVHDIGWLGNYQNYEVYPELARSYWYTWWCPVMQRYANFYQDLFKLLDESAKSGDWDWNWASDPGSLYKAAYEAYVKGDRTSESFWSEWGLWATYWEGFGVLINDQTYCHTVDYGPPTPSETLYKSTLDDYVLTYITNFIIGAEDASTWEGFVANWMAMGGEKWLDEIKAQLAG